MTHTIYQQAPLPFMGQKRKFVKAFRQILKSYPENVTIVDLFGGSGLLSHVAKREKPNATVVYNDFDNYQRRIAAIPHTNALLTRIREVTDSLPRGKVIRHPHRDRILEIIAEEEQCGFVDYITLSPSLLFSMKYANNMDELVKQTFYNTVRRNDYCADGYLDGLTIVHKDYKALFAEYRDKPNVLFLVDPPYLSTEVGTYTMSWRLADYLDVLTVLQGHDYVYFTSNKSQIIELCDWIGQNRIDLNPFECAHRVEVKTTMNYNSNYTDIMLYRKNENDEQILQPAG